jgi:hypothetical protein
MMKDGIGFALKGIKIEQFAVFENNYMPDTETGLGTEIQFKIDKENKHIGSFLGFEFVQADKTFIKIVVSCHFKIKEDAWSNFLSPHKDKLIVPKEFLTHLAMITTGTTRGVLFAKTDGTKFAKFIIPTIDLANIILNDAFFDL